MQSISENLDVYGCEPWRSLSLKMKWEKLLESSLEPTVEIQLCFCCNMKILMFIDEGSIVI